MYPKKFLLPILCIGLSSLLISCSCNPENLLKYAFSGMESLMGEGFFPSDEIRALGDFQGISVNISQTDESAQIFLKLENGDPKILADQSEILARKCAEVYLRDFKNAQDYDKIIVQFLQTNPLQPENFALEEHEFQVADFF